MDEASRISRAAVTSEITLKIITAKSKRLSQ